MFNNFIKEACKNTKNCKCCGNVYPLKIPAINTTLDKSKNINIRPFYMS